MDITISPYNLKRFVASIACLGKIGKDLYLSFDPLDGLTLSSLNEAKCAYGKFHFDSGFFERCGTPPMAAGCAGNRVSGSDEGGEIDEDEECYDARYVCRVPVRSVHSVLRPRRGVVSLRIRSEGKDDKGKYFGLNAMRQCWREGEEMNTRKRLTHGYRSDGKDIEERREGVRARNRSRKRRKQQSRIRRNDSEKDDENKDRPNSISRNSDKMMLSFEFFIEHPASKSDDIGNNPNAAVANGGFFRVLHKLGVTDANGITLSASITQRRTRSEIVSSPRIWLRLLDPLRRTAEVALTIDDELKVVTATSFHPGEIQFMPNNGGENTVLRAVAARNAAMKTETSTGVEEFGEYDFRNNRGKNKKTCGGRENIRGGASSIDQSGEESDNERSVDVDEEDGFEKESERPPLEVNQRVILVFSIKEAKAMLQYCAQTCSSSCDDEGVALSFHWGGRPVVIETEGDFFSAELVLATLHHGMIASNITGAMAGDVCRQVGK